MWKYTKIFQYNLISTQILKTRNNTHISDRYFFTFTFPFSVFVSLHEEVDSEESFEPMGSAVVLHIVEEPSQTGHLGLPCSVGVLALTVRNLLNLLLLLGRSLMRNLETRSKDRPMFLTS